MPVVNLIGTPIVATSVIPNAPGAPATDLGTRRVFTEDLRDKNSNQPVGQHSGTCTLVRKPGWWLCHAGWTLQNVGPGAGKTGNLVAGGLLDFDGQPPFMVAIFGGTGDFDKARGEISATPLPNNDWEYSIAY
jgi:hypothetical protein